MADYKSYFLMKAADVPEYIRKKLPDFFSKNAILECKEIGDGNLNYVFRVSDKNNNKTIIIKQAGQELRISKEMKLSVDRGRIEAQILTLQNSLAPGFVPHVYFYDDIMCAIAMEDMIEHEMMRTALIEHKKFPGFADQISTFLVNTLLFTSDIIMDHKKKEGLSGDFINPDLCEISHDLVFSEPFLNYNDRNNVFEPNTEFVKKELYEDEELHLEAAKLKFNFLTNAQSLIHGDLHTGSVFINPDHIFVFDPEFAFYGPMGYDIGNIIANMFFAWCNGDACIEDATQRSDFCSWTLNCGGEIIDKFIQKFNIAYDEKVNDPMASVRGFKEHYLETILSDTFGMAGLELIRRTVGMANVKDITSIKDDIKRAKYERIIITAAKRLIKERNNIKDGNMYLKILSDCIRSQQ